MSISNKSTISFQLIQIFSKTSTNLSSQNNFCTQHALSRIYKTFCSLEEISIITQSTQTIHYDNRTTMFRVYRNFTKLRFSKELLLRHFCFHFPSSKFGFFSLSFFQKNTGCNSLYILFIQAT